jgi:hypothetical protein
VKENPDSEFRLATRSVALAKYVELRREEKWLSKHCELQHCFWREEAVDEFQPQSNLFVRLVSRLQVVSLSTWDQDHQRREN